jgi:hypothetical protein
MTTKPKLKVPADSPCVLKSCIQEIGSSVCKTTCPYWPKLQELAKAGKLEVA